jgi:hypothetical protein
LKPQNLMENFEADLPSNVAVCIVELKKALT